MKISFEKNKLVYVIGILYTLNALIVVLSAWAVNLNRFGLDMTISRYIGLRRWTALLYVLLPKYAHCHSPFTIFTSLPYTSLSQMS